jgi:hypothetical protein
MAIFYGFVIKVGGDIDHIKGFHSEAEADDFCIDRTSYRELDPDDDPDHWDKWDPPVMLLVEVDNEEQFEQGKYTRPVAVYERGEKYLCVKASS